MITVHFMPMEVTTYLLCRRGRNTYRKVRIDIGMKEAIYNALPQCAIEVVDATGHIWSRADVAENRGKLTLDYKGPPKVVVNPHIEAKKEEAKQLKEDKALQKRAEGILKIQESALADAEKVRIKSFNEKLSELEKKQEEEYKANQLRSDETFSNVLKVTLDKVKVTDNEGGITSETDQRLEAKDNDDVQQVGGERSSDGETLRRPVHLQVSLVGKVDARLERTEERGAEGGSDGLHSSDDEPNVLDNRHAPRVRLISPADEDSGRD